MRKNLGKEEASVLYYRFGLHDGQTRTIRQVGEAMGISYSRAKQVLFTALSKMRRPHVAHALQDYVREDGPP